MQQFYIAADPVRLFPTNAIPQSDSIYAAVLTAGAEQEITVPEGARLVRFAVDGNGDFYCRFDAASAISEPTTTVTDGSAPELNPDIRICEGVTTIHLVASANCIVTLAFYS